MEKGAKREGKTVWEVARYYTKFFLADIEALNIEMPEVMPRATETIPEMIEIVKILLEKGAAYETDEAIYFDISKFPDYEKLTGQKFKDKKQGARDEVVTDPQKKNPADFALWFKTVGRFKEHTMHWSSPWGEGFPGWHIECSAMSRKFLGQPFDLHTSAIDHTKVHHPNEIAQSEAAYGIPLANYWVHAEFLLVDGHKMSKSLGNLFRLSDLEEKSFSPLDFRYLTLTAHYRNKLNFTWEGLKAASAAHANLRNLVSELNEPAEPDEKYLNEFRLHLENDLNTAEALAVLWKLIKSPEIASGVKRATVNEMDKVLGLNLAGLKPEVLSPEIAELVERRDFARQSRDWKKSDELRRNLEAQGFSVEDGPQGTKVRKNS